MLRISLVTLGSPEQLTGGYLYHRRVADLAPRHGATVDFVSVPAAPFPLPALVTRRTLREALRADVTVVDSIAAALLAPSLAAGPTGLPLVGMLHQPPGGIDHGAVRATLQARLDRATYRRCRRLLVASAPLARAVADVGPPVEVIPPGADVAPPPEGPPPDLRRGHGVAIVAVGNWVPRKGIVELLDAFASLPASAAVLHLVGRTDADRRYAAAVWARLASQGLADRVVVHGPVSRAEVAALYAGADVFALPSSVEPYGTVYGEALAAGLPLVGWRAGNLPHLIDDGTEGLLAEPGDLGALAAALRRLAQDEAVRRRLTDAARRRGARLPSWEDTAGRFFSALRDVR